MARMFEGTKFRASVAKQIKGVTEKRDFRVGVLKDKTHRRAVWGPKGKTSLAGGPARRASGKSSGNTISEVSKSFRAQTGINIFTLPFKNKRNKNILQFLKDFDQVVYKKKAVKRIENTLQAVIRNPILRGDYGSNTKITAKLKGFNRLAIDTGQLFKNIIAKAVKRV